MSYDLFLTFKNPVRRKDFLSFFAGRKHYQVEGQEIGYENPDTGVYFSYSCTSKRNFLLREFVSEAALNLNYFRPSFFGLEAEGEVSALVAAFEPKIEDPQLDGMGSGPYSQEGFLRGWNTGNEFGVRAFIQQETKTVVPFLPSSVIQGVWDWNSSRTSRMEKLGQDQFIPLIMYFDVDGKTCTAAIWPEALPVILPVVDMVLIGRKGSGDSQSFSFIPWRTIADFLVGVGFAEEKTGFNLHYEKAPQNVLDFVNALPETDLSSLIKLSPDQVLDEELFQAARIAQ